MFTMVEIIQCFLVSQPLNSWDYFSALKIQVWMKERVRVWFALSVCSLWGREEDRERKGVRNIDCHEGDLGYLWFPLSRIFHGVSEYHGDVSDTASEPRCPSSPRCSFGNF